MAQEKDGLIWEIESTLPERLISGEGNLLYICGWCFYHQQLITQLEITVNDTPYPVIAHSTSRADIVMRYASQAIPREIGPQIGFWALVPIFKPQAPEVVKIGLEITLDDQTEINCPVGELTVYPDQSYIEEEPCSLPPSTNDAPLIAIC